MGGLGGKSGWERGATALRSSAAAEECPAARRRRRARIGGEAVAESVVGDDEGRRELVGRAVRAEEVRAASGEQGEKWKKQKRKTGRKMAEKRWNFVQVDRREAKGRNQNEKS